MGWGEWGPVPVLLPLLCHDDRPRPQFPPLPNRDDHGLRLGQLWRDSGRDAGTDVPSDSAMVV